MERERTALVIQGGSLRSVFTFGILDAFMACGFNPFDIYVGVSSGSMALSYYLADQYRAPYEIVRALAQDDNFISFKQLFADEGYLNLSYLENYSQRFYPLDTSRALEHLGADKVLEIVATDMATALPVYLRPTPENWLTCMRASSTLPFVTRGVCKLDGKTLMDGGWSDAIPARRAVELGATRLIVIRTLPLDHKLEWSYMGMFGGFYHRNNPALAKRFSHDHEFYNDSVDWLLNPPAEIDVLQIAPDDFLRTGNYSSNVQNLRADYYYGISKGVDFIRERSAEYL